MDVLGDDYIAQHVLSQLEQERREKVYRVYVTDCLYCIAQGGRMQRRYEDVINDMDRPNETRSAEEIKAHMLKRLGEG